MLECLRRNLPDAESVAGTLALGTITLGQGFETKIFDKVTFQRALEGHISRVTDIKAASFPISWLFLFVSSYAVWRAHHTPGVSGRLSDTRPDLPPTNPAPMPDIARQ